MKKNKFLIFCCALVFALVPFLTLANNIHTASASIIPDSIPTFTNGLGWVKVNDFNGLSPKDLQSFNPNNLWSYGGKTYYNNGSMSGYELNNDLTFSPIEWKFKSGSNPNYFYFFGQDVWEGYNDSYLPLLSYVYEYSQSTYFSYNFEIDVNSKTLNLVTNYANVPNGQNSFYGISGRNIIFDYNPCYISLYTGYDGGNHGYRSYLNNYSTNGDTWESSWSVLNNSVINVQPRDSQMNPNSKVTINPVTVDILGSAFIEYDGHFFATVFNKATSNFGGIRLLALDYVDYDDIPYFVYSYRASGTSDLINVKNNITDNTGISSKTLWVDSNNNLYYDNLYSVEVEDFSGQFGMNVSSMDWGIEFTANDVFNFNNKTYLYNNGNFYLLMTKNEFDYFKQGYQSGKDDPLRLFGIFNYADFSCINPNGVVVDNVKFNDVDFEAINGGFTMKQSYFYRLKDKGVSIDKNVSFKITFSSPVNIAQYKEFIALNFQNYLKLDFFISSGENITYDFSKLQTTLIDLTPYQKYQINSITLSNFTLSQLYDKKVGFGTNVLLTDSYNKGFIDGQNAFDTKVPYNNGYNDGYSTGVKDGVEKANKYSFYGLFSAIIDVPVNTFLSLLNVEVGGVNLSSFFLALMTAGVVILIIRLCTGKGGDK